MKKKFNKRVIIFLESVLDIRDKIINSDITPKEVARYIRLVIYDYIHSVVKEK